MKKLATLLFLAIFLTTIAPASARGGHGHGVSSHHMATKTLLIAGSAKEGVAKEGGIISKEAAEKIFVWAMFVMITGVFILKWRESRKKED